MQNTTSYRDLIEVIITNRTEGTTTRWTGTADSRRMTAAISKLRVTVAGWQHDTRLDEGFATDFDNPLLDVKIRDHRTFTSYVTTASALGLVELTELLDAVAHRAGLNVELDGARA